MDTVDTIEVKLEHLTPRRGSFTFCQKSASNILFQFSGGCVLSALLSPLTFVKCKHEYKTARHWFVIKDNHLIYVLSLLCRWSGLLAEGQSHLQWGKMFTTEEKNKCQNPLW